MSSPGHEVIRPHPRALYVISACKADDKTVLSRHFSVGRYHFALLRWGNPDMALESADGSLRHSAGDWRTVAA